MKIVCLGVKGMLGSDIAVVCSEEQIEFRGYDLPELDITREEDISKIGSECDWVINCAGYTDVDGAEQDESLAMRVNAYGVRYVAEWCRRNAIGLLHLSTDYVFDGNARRPYREGDPVNPLNVYGRSKLAGENFVREICEKHIIVRTQTLFGVNGENFVTAILRQLHEVNTGKRKKVRVVEDQITSPTYTRHLAEAILKLIRTGYYGTVHVSASGECSLYKFAVAIGEAIGMCNVIEPVKTIEYVTRARRPLYSVLDKSRLIELIGRPLPEWRIGLQEFLEQVQRVSPGLVKVMGR